MSEEQKKSGDEKVWVLRLFAPVAIFVIAVIFVVNVLTHGKIQHPGKTTYEVRCAQCHGENGEGIRELIPPLLNSDFAINNFDSIPCWLKKGITHAIIVNGKNYEQPMYGLDMGEVEIANVINYINKEMLNNDAEINANEVKDRLKNCY